MNVIFVILRVGDIFIGRVLSLVLVNLEFNFVDLNYFVVIDIWNKWFKLVML